MDNTLDLVGTYFPELKEISESDLLDMRARLVAYTKKNHPDIDIRPNSVYGDTVITPFAELLAAAEIALKRVRSDVDLEQVAAGVIYDCEFVRRFLRNFAATPREGLYATGIVRLVFADDSTREIDRSLRIQFNSDAQSIFYLKLPEAGNLNVMRIGSAQVAGVNNPVLFQTAPDRFAVDVPVYGAMTSNVVTGNIAALDRTIPGLASCTALIDFDNGQPAFTLPALANRTRSTFYAASSNSRGGFRSFLLKEYPDVVAVSPVLSGDAEMLRDTVNALGTSLGAVDLFARSKSHQNIEEHIISLPLILEQDSVEVNRFIGKLNLAGQPLQILSITATGNPALNLDDGVDSLLIFSQSKNSVKAPMLAAAYSEHEQLWLSIKMPVDSDSFPLIPTTINVDGTQTANFTIRYKTDPMLPVVAAQVNNEENRTTNSDVLVRSFIPIVFKRLVIRYTRAAGVNIKLDQARSEIYDYFQTLGHPTVYSDSRILDSMFFAGASTVKAIESQANLQWSIARLILPDDVDTPDIDHAAAVAGAITSPYMEIRSSKGFLLQYRDPDMGTADALYAAAGVRNIGFLLGLENIVFQEEL